MPNKETCQQENIKIFKHVFFKKPQNTTHIQTLKEEGFQKKYNQLKINKQITYKNKTSVNKYILLINYKNK